MPEEKTPEKPAKPDDDFLDADIDETILEDDLRVILGARPLPFSDLIGGESARLAARKKPKVEERRRKKGGVSKKADKT